MIYNVEPFNAYKWQNFVMGNLKRNNVIVAPRQHGKTALMCEITNSVALAPFIKRPLINLCSDEASTLYKLYSQELNQIFKYNPLWSWNRPEVPSSRVLRGDGNYALVNFIGSIKKPTGCTGTSPHLNVIDEAAKVAFEFIYKSAMPATDKTEGITIITGTPEDNQFRDIFEGAVEMMEAGNPDWFAFYMQLDDPWSQDALSKKARQAIWNRYNLEDPKQKQIFETQYLCLWESGSKEGKPYARLVKQAEQEGRVQEFNVNRDYPVGLAWDDGRATTAVWAYQLIGSAIYLLDYREWYEGDLPTIGKNRYNWYKENGFTVGAQILPHTFKEKSFTLASKISRKQQLIQLLNREGVYIDIPKVGKIDTKIIAGKRLLPKCIIHPRCEDQFRGITSLKRYSRQATIHKLTGDKIYTDNIAKDKYSHCGDSFGELAMAYTSKKLQQAIATLAVRKSIIPVSNLSKHTLLSPY